MSVSGGVVLCLSVSGGVVLSLSVSGGVVQYNWNSPPCLSVVEHSHVEERFRWEWKLVFKKLCVDLSQAVEGLLLDQMQSSLSTELSLWEKKHVIQVVRLDAALQGSKLEYPRVTSQVSRLSSLVPPIFSVLWSHSLFQLLLWHYCRDHCNIYIYIYWNQKCLMIHFKVNTGLQRWFLTVTSDESRMWWLM